jgi:XTP/dITP diphosphohydrolase
VAEALVLATRNAHKLAEVGRMLVAYGVSVEGLPPEVVLPPEDGETFIANALPKARAAARALGRPVIADDSGIEADAIGGLPGVRSARYAGERASDAENLAKLLREAPEGSGLRYVCALAFVDPVSGVEQIFEGDCFGRLTGRPRGEGGFGYDPAFVPDALRDGRTMAELSDTEKDAISHRGAAITAFAQWWTR